MEHTMKFKQTNLFGGEDEVSEPMTEEQLNRAILNYEGVAGTQAKLIEEMSELTEAILSQDIDHITEEAVDVSIVLNRLFMTLNKYTAARKRDFKIKRTEKRLKEGKL